MLAEKGNNEESFIALDEIKFLQTEICSFAPPEAIPTEPPTEPPGRKLRILYKPI